MTRIFVYGSCVSRDTVDAMDRATTRVLGYVARSSLVSALGVAAALPHVDMSSLSPFQKRQLENDLTSSLPQILRQSADSIDVLLWDLVDERLGFYVDGAGAVISDSIELRKALGNKPVLHGFEHVAFGSDRHLTAFDHALDAWTSLLKNENLLERTLLLAPAWAESATNGDVVPSSFGVRSGRANTMTQRYVDLIRGKVGIPVVVPRVEVLADPEHQWGPAPFHYSRSVYRSLIEQINAFALRRETKEYQGEL